MTPKINKEACLGCGTCAAIAPTVFRMGDDGKAEVIEGDHSSEMEVVNQAVSACPVAAITVE